MSKSCIIYEKIEELNIINEEIRRKFKFLYLFRDTVNEINVILVTNEDKVYCYGENHNGVLGFGHNKVVNVLTFNEDLSVKQIVGFKNTFYHTIARTCDAKLYCWGANTFSGNGRENKGISKPELNKYLINENIIDMCCGASHTLVLTSHSEVYAWGENAFGQIGNGINGKDEIQSTPLKLNEFNGEKIKGISCGSSHSLALTESGCVYSWGGNDCGQLGLNNKIEIENKPKRIQIEVKIKKISCGPEHSLLLSREGHIYVFGSNEFKELGLSTDRMEQLRPIKLNHSEKFIEISSHHSYMISAALSEKGAFYVWGYMGEGRIISEPKETRFKSFEEIFAMIDNDKVFKNKKYINNWKEIEKLGEGSYGTVFKVQHKANKNKIFAMKKIKLLYENSYIEYSEKEYVNSGTFEKLNNEFLVKYHESWIEHDFQMENYIRKVDDNSTLYIQMDFCDTTLSAINEEIIKDSRLFSNNSLTQLGYYIMSELFIEIFKGVKYLHNNKIIHRDLHPYNILLKMRKNGNCIKIADFGLAKIHDENKLNTGDIGNITYAAPELLDSEYYDTKVDIYSLGVILQELFHINDDSVDIYNGNQTSLFNSKLKYITVLSTRMRNEDYRERPNCEQILAERKNWAINESEFNIKQELFKGLLISKKNRSYVQNIAVTKLLHKFSRQKSLSIHKNHLNRDYIQNIS